MINTLNKKFDLRIEASKASITDIINKEVTIDDKVSSYVTVVTKFINDMFKLESSLNEDYFTSHTFDELLALNHSYYADITGDAYNTSFANPIIAVESFGKELGRLLSSVYVSVRQCIGFAFEQRQVSIMWKSELVQEIVEVLNTNRELINNHKDNESLKTVVESLINILKANAAKDAADKFNIELYRKFSPEFKVYSQQVINMDLTDQRYIFRYGMYVSYNEIELMKYFATCSHKQLQNMANTYTEAFYRGFIKKSIDLNTKSTVNVGYHIGFEAVISLAVKNFERLGLSPLVYYTLKGINRPRLMNTKPSKQMEYDHKFDDGLYIDKKTLDDQLELATILLEENKEMIGQMAGPAVMEIFGDTPFAPESKKECIKYSDEVKELKNDFNNSYQQLFSKYLPRSNYSFVLISYPVPEIGEQFKEIFDETILVNTLDESVYMEVQQKIIEALDKGKSVRVTGRNGNRTDFTISMNDMLDTSKQTNFNNCTADVNVPVGEVFTSPKLSGTNGKLHVKEVYLHGLKFIDLDINFKDGMMDTYTCKNFDTDEENLNYILENLTHPHKTLPLGEFAIGTNTTAYAMAKKYNIEKIIPILIGEKMGPHFAVGDTCYSWSEDVAIFNPDGREIVARENSKTANRIDNIKDAYTYCHTDITIPYSELDLITVNLIKGGTLDIIRGGRFVLVGTELLNAPLKGIEV